MHGTKDEIVPFHTATVFCEAMRKRGLKARLGVVSGVRHVHDLNLKEGDEGWWEGVGVGYEFLFGELGL